MKLLVRFLLSLSLVLLLLGGYASLPRHTYQNTIGSSLALRPAQPVVKDICLIPASRISLASKPHILSRIKKEREILYAAEEDDEYNSDKLIPSRKCVRILYSFAAFFCAPGSVSHFPGCLAFHQYFPGTSTYRHLMLCVIRI